jgi:hypothetical protein
VHRGLRHVLADASSRTTDLRLSSMACLSKTLARRELDAEHAGTGSKRGSILFSALALRPPVTPTAPFERKAYRRLGESVAVQ